MTAAPEPASPAARTVALEALAGVLDRRQPLDEAFAAAPALARLAPRDRAFARLLVMTALRRLGELEALIDGMLERPLPRAARMVRHILALGACQLLILGTPAHAAVDTSVRLAAKVAGGRFRGLVNAVLRRLDADGRARLADLDGPRLDIPPWLWRTCADAYGEDAARRIAEAHMTEPPLDLTPRDPAEAGVWAGRLGAEVLPTGSLRRPGGGRIEDLEGFGAGAWWVQDAAAALPARLFPAPRDRRILDMCAAPGGKTLQLLGAGAHVTALDPSPERLELVRENLARIGLMAELVCADGRAYDPGLTFDGVLLDAPCSASGTIRRHPDIARIKTGTDAARMTPLQDALLDRAAALTAPGGTLVYAVCSLDPEEGEHRVARFLDRQRGFRRIPVDAPALGGEESWRTPAGDLRTLPFFMAEKGGMDGFFAARLQRHGEAAR
ncbi:MAG: transcription antitermination factor NusB [Alphaproteobacteria bacterium]|nr:transcription antitermination factor NusB [Alphaproteobacteria bacterium]